ncbi:hypothetical protein TNIN_273461 [Trichonephila inaurata madagascariensis]|uniref:Uncharacterized protein n=1 Tax=Trichonephila inaurata madagascariensis TaxID=2747483 RepID=A0A8X6X3I5_9ARAC|nr:hypothetical protein TNIN_273461 [Trichonephila inaurata madagascariensis]
MLTLVLPRSRASISLVGASTKTGARVSGAVAVATELMPPHSQSCLLEVFSVVSSCNAMEHKDISKNQFKKALTAVPLFDTGFVTAQQYKGQSS